MARVEKTDYQKIILGVIAMTGIIAFAVVAPNCVQLLDLLPNQKSKKKYQINRAIDGLIKKNLIRLTINSSGHKVVRLTKAGQEKLKEYKLSDLKITKPKRWDGKYRVIIFDIKEWKRSTRNKLRKWLEHLGLVRLQNSVWVCPYDCQEVITLLKANYKIGKEVLYLEVSYLENDGWLRKIFSLS